MAHTAFLIRIGDRGRLVLPAELRRAAGLATGDVVLATLDDDGLRLTSRAQMARAGRGMFTHLAPHRDLVGELITERRADAERESPDAPTRRPTG